MTRKRRESRTGMFVGSAALVGVYLAIHNGPVKPGPAVHRPPRRPRRTRLRRPTRGRGPTGPQRYCTARDCR